MPAPARPDSRIEIFRSATIPKAVASLAIPTVISQLITMIYNLADTFFVGQMGDPNRVAAVSLVFPAFMMLNAIANLFGVGGSSVISRYLGAGEVGSARKTSAFCVYATIAVTLLFSLSVLILKTPVLKLLGANQDTEGFASEYLFWVVIVGGVPTSLGIFFGHIVRSEGGARQSSIGMSIGGLLNMILDPIFIFPMGLGVRGAALATMLSSCVTVVYFLRYIYRARGKTIICLDPGKITLQRQVVASVASVGLPASLHTILSLVSNTVLNNLASTYGAASLAAAGIVKRIDMVPMNVTTGISQGVLPFIGYNYGARRFDRVRKINGFARFIAVSFSLLCIAAFELWAERIVGFFISDARTIQLGATFLRILCLTTPMMAISYLITTMFQAMGQGRRALAISVFRKATIDVPLMFLMNHLVPVYGIFWVQPIVDTLSVGLSFALYRGFARRLKEQSSK